MANLHYDWVIVGSGFGGSVSAYRLVQKGYSVLVVEKGRRFAPEDFAKTNWDLKRWLWNPGLGFKGIFQMTFLRHLTVFHGVGVGGGSLVYANTLPTPQPDFFSASSWSDLGDWEKELAPHYATAKRMLGATRCPVTHRCWPKQRSPRFDHATAAAITSRRARHSTAARHNLSQPTVQF